jgi:hypothetical protein
MTLKITNLSFFDLKGHPDLDDFPYIIDVDWGGAFRRNRLVGYSKICFDFRKPMFNQA